MNKIDKRTGEPFPSVQRADAIRALLALPDSRSQGHAKTLQGLEFTDLSDASRDWTLTLDPLSLRQYGVFADHRVLVGERTEDDPESVEERPLEWFQRVGELTHEFLTVGDHGLWDVINDLFDQAIAEADNELGFADQ